MTSTPLFWLFALALAAVTLAILVVPLLRRRGELPPEEESAAAAVFRDHRRQVEADFTAGTITSQERDAALDDLLARFGGELAAQPDADKGPPRTDRPQWVSAVIIAALLPMVAGGLYFVLGNPKAIDAPLAKDEPPANDPQVVAMVDGLAKRLQQNPEDGNGWALLGRSYRTLGRFEAAGLAYGEAAKRLPPDAALLTEWAESVVQLQGRSFAGQPTELLGRALAADPNYPKALAMSGAAAMERNDLPTAVTQWKRLKAVLPPDNPEMPQIDALIARLEAAAAQGGSGQAASTTAGPTATAKPGPAPTAGTAGGARPDVAPAAGPTAAARPGPAPSPSAASAAKPAPMASAAPMTKDSPPALSAASPAGSAVGGRVELDPKLAARAAPGDTVFIFARDPDGSRMPLAAIRLTVGELPKTFSLNDSMAMAPTATISAAKRIVVEARISKSGQATAQTGDLAGLSVPVAPGARDVRVLIDRVLP